MAKSSSHTGDPIEHLLQERNQYTTWLARLDTTADTAPEGVRTRIRADYQSRLESVVEQLRQHSDELAAQLDRARNSRTELVAQEDKAKERLSEAEIRHAVGEYGEERWQELRAEEQRKLVGVREELAKVTEEIAELEKVQALIAAPVKPELPELVVPEAAPAAPPAPTPTPEPAAEAVSTPPPAAAPVPSEPAAASPPEAAPPKPQIVRPPRPREAPAAGRAQWFPSKEGGSGRGDLDELAFLKSVTDDDKDGPSPRRASGGVPRPAEAMTPSTPSSKPSEATSHSGAHAAGVEPGGSRGSAQNAARTLKCGECGTMNRPTEWYCERCGAELADL